MGRGKTLAGGPRPRPQGCRLEEGTGSEPAGMCRELVTEGGRRGQADGPGEGREAQVLLSRLHLLRGR